MYPKRGRLADSIGGPHLWVVLLVVIVASAFLAPWLTPYDSTEPSYEETAQAPSLRHPMGTDLLGRDVLTRVLYGARLSLGIALTVQLLGVVVGILLGATSAYFGGLYDYTVMRIVDAMYAFPSLLFSMLVLVWLGPGVTNVLLALGIVSWVPICRLCRAQVLQLREVEFVAAARALGLSDMRILLRHLVPNAVAPVIVAAVLGIPEVVFSEAGLSFLGLGVAPPTPSWGQMIGTHYRDIQAHWHLSVFPMIMMSATAYAFMKLGDAAQAALDPRTSAVGQWRSLRRARR